MSSVKTMDEVFAKDILSGLKSSPKTLPSRYFYDKKGDKIFQNIMKMKEYYLTACEYEIFSMQKESISNQFIANDQPFNLIEFGAGDGYKTKVLLNHLVSKNIDFTYMPVDISAHVLDILINDLSQNLPQLNTRALEGEYFKALENLNSLDNTRKVILFLGSNIGNFTSSQAHDFLREMSQFCNPGDLVFIGFDLKKDPGTILQAYGDPNGITASFNLNLLDRINRELGGDFDVNSFTHFPKYNPLTGTTTSFLISKKQQAVYLEELNEKIVFDAWEPIHMEISQKFDENMIEDLAESSGFSIIENFYDCKHYFVDSLWKYI